MKNISQTLINPSAGQGEEPMRVLFVCHGNILKSPEKVCKINRFTKQNGTYYTTTTPFFQ